MTLLHAGVDTAVIALWLGHADIRSTQIYLHADMTIKERALARTTPHPSSPADTARRPAAGLPRKPVIIPTGTPDHPRPARHHAAPQGRIGPRLGIIPGSG